MLTAGDIGGTKTDVAIFSNEAGPHAPLHAGDVSIPAGRVSRDQAVIVADRAAAAAISV